MSNASTSTSTTRAAVVEPVDERFALLGAAIDDEVAAIDRLIGLLRAEQHALVTDSAVGIELATATKQSAIGAATERRKVRIDAMALAGVPRDPISAELTLASDSTLGKRWRGLRAAAREATLLNALNGKLVTQRLQTVAARLDALRSDESAALYDAAGRTGDGGARRVIAAA